MLVCSIQKLEDFILKWYLSQASRMWQSLFMLYKWLNVHMKMCTHPKQLLKPLTFSWLLYSTRIRLLHAKISSISTPWGRKRVYVQLWLMAKFHAQIWQFWKSPYISETAACRANTSSISTLWDRKRVYVQLLALWPMAKFHAQIWQFENQPISWTPLPVELKQAQFRPPRVERGYVCNFCHFGQWPSFMPKYGTLANG